ncbi:beta-ketoacyl-[acyl-carrier-protein] synthase family protein [Shewanella sp. MMG014]|uniref:beta-ketoacyl-[acyl-carrier-protein] synthase family protein n=1 Tax=Shewanella sp. MMG014 TaxID=2822691 RepID=UPI001B3675F2|nr:beta-ketoacyl-[acyl-carrier-protein] synthase family protein [Shewanella sp. MMG014]MBQ4890103.1 beta-ketoacyl-[acyl-carrier-protein] synthase family protein [Shewanella sp. MMG014]
MSCAIAITQIGLCTPLGNSSKDVLQNLLSASTDAMVLRDDLLFNASTRVGAINNANLLDIPAELTQFDCRNNQLLYTAAASITADIEHAKKQYGADRVAVVLGTSTSGISKGEAALAYHQQHGEFPPSYHYAQQELGSASDFLRQLYQLSGPCYTVSTACSSSAKVFASAKRLLLADLCDVVIVGGVDSLCQLTLNGFNALESVSKGLCNPFSQHRDGINIGEGAALFVLKKAQEDAQSRSKSQVYLAGIGESSDAHHISAPHPQGLGAISAMQAALADASITSAQISYVNLHGTATPKNDAMESLAMQQVFNSSNNNEAASIPLCSSTKPLVGHCLGAAGAIEAAFCYLLLSDANLQQQLPPHVWDQQQDMNNPILPFVTPGQSAELTFIMSNSFAFGGSNASVIFAKCGALT